MQHIVRGNDVAIHDARTLQPSVYFLLREFQLGRQFPDALGNEFQSDFIHVASLSTCGLDVVLEWFILSDSMRVQSYEKVFTYKRYSQLF